MKPVYLILPHNEPTRAKPLMRWLSELPELKLLATVCCLDLAWKNGVTGEPQDWLSTIALIHQHWNEAEGFVVWAPQASLLELAGTAALMFKQAGKPIVFFSSPYPDLASVQPSDLIGLKSRLINATYIAGADLGEIGILINQALYRPSACSWGNQSEQLQPASVQPPLATIDFQLHLQGDYARRSNDVRVETNPAFETRFSFLSWHPGSSALYQPTDVEAVMVAAESAYWPHQDVQQLRQSIHQAGKPVIWYSHQAWPRMDWQSNEIGVAHDQSWWAALVAQYAFGEPGEKADTEKSLQRLQNLIAF